MWLRFYQAVMAKSARSIRLTWVKGHATQEHVDKGITTIENKVGNQEVDAVAGLGTALHGEDVMLAAKCMSARHGKYLKFMKMVSHHIIEAYSIHRELTSRQDKIDEEQRIQGERKKISYQALSYPDEAITQPIHNNATIHDYSNYLTKNGSAKHIEHFLANAKISAAPVCRKGISWTELYILYRISE